MKKLVLVIVAATLLMVNSVSAQKEKVAVINFDTQGILLSPENIRKMVNLEIQKLDTYQVLDEYDLLHIVKTQNLILDDCFGKQCATEVGKIFEVNKVITGSVIRIDERITYTMRMIDVETSETEKSVVYEFANLQPHLQKMTEIMTLKLLDLPIDEQKLSELEIVDEPVIASKSSLRASGPRMGGAYITNGAITKYLDATDRYHFMTQIGYQAEVQYMSTGNFQALVEFVGVVSGLDQELIIPSISILNGIRNSKTGYEFALGPVFGLRQEVEYNEDGTLSRDPYINEKKPLRAKFLFSVGRTFKSGNLNVPVNLYVSPSKSEGWYVGTSVGFNLAKRRK